MTTTPTALHPLTLDDPSPFLIEDSKQIAHLMQRLGKRPELVCLYPGQKQAHFALSALLGLSAGKLYFDVSPDARINQILASSAYLTCVSGLDRVHIQFTALDPSLGELDGRPALVATPPSALLYVQRRDYFRLAVPAQPPLYCRITLNDGHHVVNAQILDISLGGVSLLGPIPDLIPHQGLRLLGCRIELPEVGRLEADLMISTTRDQSPHGGARSLRIGCRFLQLNSGQQKLVQLYINRLERQRLAHT